MATTQDALGRNVIGTVERARPIGGVQFDWAVVTVSAWLVGGLFIDGWAHNHGLADTTFFTPWHAVFYTGYLACAVVIAGAMLLNRVRGHAWNRALPAGYELSLFGVAVFAIGGVGDLLWHTLFGIEVNTEALLSPTHLLLATGITLIATGPLRAAWKRPAKKSERRLMPYLPMLLSATMLLSLFTFMTQFAYPFVNSWTIEGTRPGSSADIRVVATIVGMMMQGTLFAGLVLTLLRRWTLPLGSLALLFIVNGALMMTQQDEWRFLPVSIITGLVAEFLIWKLKPSPTQPRAFRLFAFILPVIFFSLFFLTLATTSRVWWTIHMWGGSLVLAGVAGLLLSYVMVPPAAPPDEA